MKKSKILGFAIIASTFVAQAQDLEPAKKAIDAEQFEKAKGLLKTIIQSKPTSGKASFLLGNVYLKQNIADSAKIFFQKGLTGDGGKINNIGLAQMDLDANDNAAAQAKFDLVIKDLKKKDIEEYVFIARAYMNAEKPDFKKAIELLNKAKAVNPTDSQVQLALGDALYGDKKQSESYVAYRNAYQTDPSLIRAKMQLGVLLKGSSSFEESIKAFNEVKGIDPNYGPVYRELAETYNKWAAFKPSKSVEYQKIALENYTKYMSLTDYSMTSRMRYADFLVKNKDYKALEAEANKMKELDGVNPRIMRYLGYSAYENGNADAALTAMNQFINNPANKVIGRDYQYLGMAKIKKAIGADGVVSDATLLNEGFADVKKAIEIEPLLAADFSDVGKGYFSQKQYGIASKYFEIALSNPESKTVLDDSMYYAICVYTDNRGKEGAALDTVSLENASKALDNLVVRSPEYQEAYLYNARLNNSLGKDELMATNYQKFLDLVLVKSPDDIAKNKAKIIESYNNMASHFANTDKAKAKELLAKTLAIDPANNYAIESLKLLK